MKKNSANLVKKIPGPKAKRIIKEEEKYLAKTTKHLPLAVKRGSGVFVEDVDGNVFLDFTTGVCVTNIGISHRQVVKAISAQAKDFIYFAGTDFSYAIQAELAKKITKLTPGNFAKKVFYANSGAESVEAAIKIAKWSTRRSQFIGFIGGFHGRTIGANAFIGCKTIQRERYFPMMAGVVQVPYAYCYRCAYHEQYPECDIWCAKILEEVYFKHIISPSETAAILVESIQGEGGYIVPPDEFLRELRRITAKYGILLIDDEVQTGLGRTGKMFAAEHSGIVPDVVTIAKGLASGLPIGATIYNSRYDFKVKGAHSNTFGGNPVCCAAALATISVIEKEKLVAQAGEKGAYIKRRLMEMQRKYDFIGDVRGRGMSVACELVADPVSKTPVPELTDYIVEECFQQRLILMPCGSSAIRFVPALNIARAELDRGLDTFAAALKKSAQRFDKFK